MNRFFSRSQARGSCWKQPLQLSLALMCTLVAIGSQQARAVTIVHSNDVLGEIEPCGCRSNPLGGMARKANFLKKIKDPAVIQLDAGDLLFPTDVIPEALKKQSFLQAQYLLKAMDMLHHDAVVPGEKDFALGYPSLEKLIHGSKVHFIAANLKLRNGKQAFPPHLILKRKDENGKTVRVAVFGLVGNKNIKWPKTLKITSPIAAARREVKELSKKADYVIALTHEGYNQDKVLAKKVHGIDVIIGAHSETFLQTPRMIGKTMILQSSFRNQYVGELPLTHPLKSDSYQLVGLDPNYQSPANAPGPMDKLVTEFKAKVAKLNSEEESRMEASLNSSLTPSQKKTKYQTFVRCSECHLKQFNFWRKTPHARALDALYKVKQAQNKECLSCHSVGMGDPQGYAFVTRLAELRTPASDGSEEDKLKEMPLDDLHKYLKTVVEAESLDTPVQVTPQSKAVPLRESLNQISQSFAPVQCENCHLPGRDHPFSEGYSKKVDTTQTCLKCHTPARAPGWYKGPNSKEPDWDKIKAKRALVTCPAGELTTE